MVQKTLWTRSIRKSPPTDVHFKSMGWVRTFYIIRLLLIPIFIIKPPRIQEFRKADFSDTLICDRASAKNKGPAEQNIQIEQAN